MVEGSMSAKLARKMLLRSIVRDWRDDAAVTE